MKKILYIIVVLILGLHEAKAIENNCPNPSIADVFYSDGTCSADYIPSKNAIGIIYWLGAKKKGGLIMALDESSKLNWSNAVSYCNSYSKYGVMGWKLPELGEFVPMGVEQPYGISNNKYNILNDKLATISGATKLLFGYYWSGSETYSSANNSWYMYPLNGDTFYSNKVNTNYARCVLAF